jgi:hypothetical protein
MVCGPVLFRLFLERGCVLQYLRPLLLAVLQEEVGVEFNAVFYLDLGRLSMLEPNLVVLMARRSIADALLRHCTYLVRRSTTFDKQHFHFEFRSQNQLKILRVRRESFDSCLRDFVMDVDIDGLDHLGCSLAPHYRAQLRMHHPALFTLFAISQVQSLK